MIAREMPLPVELAALMLALPIATRQGPLPDLQPRTYTSSDGHWTLFVDPTQRDGGGPGRYRCARDGNPMWSGAKPWTFCDAVVTNEGISAGYSYSEGGLQTGARGEFHVVIIAANGDVWLDESHERVASKVMMDASPDPRGTGVFYQSELKRIVFRVVEATAMFEREAWWAFQLPDAKSSSRARLHDALPKGDSGGFGLVAREVPGTPLTMVEWQTLASDGRGLRLTLHDAELALVWDMAWPDALTAADPRMTSEWHFAEFGRGTLLDEAGAGRFAIGLPKSGEKVRFAVERAENSEHGWSVREIGREKWSFTAGSARGPSFLELPLAELSSRGTFDLATGASGSPPIRDIVAFDFAAGGALRVVGHDKDRLFVCMRASEAGEVLHETRFELADASHEFGVRFWPLGASTWLAAQSSMADRAVARAWRIDEDTGAVTRLAELACPEIEDAASLGGNRFVVVGTSIEGSSPSSYVCACDADGRKLWAADERFDKSKPSSLLHPSAVAVTADGDVAVVDSIRRTLQVFGSDGAFSQCVELDKAWGRKAKFPVSVRADVDGGLLVYDQNGDPPLYRMRIDGTVRESLSPRRFGGKTVEALARTARVAPDGKLWSTDGQRLLRMNEQGIVDFEVGAPPDVDVLAEPSATTIDVFGRVLVQDKATGSVHAFDGRGQRLFVCRPAADELANPNPIGHLAATCERGVIVRSMRKVAYVVFGPDGTRQREVEMPRNMSQPVFSPTSDAAYACLATKGFAQLGADLQVHATIERAPDGTWMENQHGPAIAPDGAVALVDVAEGLGAKPGADLLLYESADLSAPRSIPLPRDVTYFRLALGRKWAALAQFSNEVVLVHRADGKLLRFAVPGVDEDKDKWSFGLDPDDDELIAFDSRARKVYRFALP
jgi:sugar lactone lactonase YvrE